MEESLRKHKKEVILVLATLLLAAAGMIVFHMLSKGSTAVKITLHGEVYGTYSLEEEQTIVIETGEGRNVFEIKDGQIRMVEADCPDKICMGMYPLSADFPGVIVCLPHEIIAELK